VTLPATSLAAPRRAWWRRSFRLSGARTKDAIITVEKAPDGTLKVETGTLVPYRSGHGNWYQLKKVHGQWRIIADGIWIV